MIVECRGTKLWPICAGASQYGLLYPKRGVLGGRGWGKEGGGGESQPTNKQNESLCTEKGDKSVQCRLPLVRATEPTPPHTNRDLII